MSLCACWATESSCARFSHLYHYSRHSCSLTGFCFVMAGGEKSIGKALLLYGFLSYLGSHNLRAQAVLLGKIRPSFTSMVSYKQLTTRLTDWRARHNKGVWNFQETTSPGGNNVFIDLTFSDAVSVLLVIPLYCNVEMKVGLKTFLTLYYSSCLVNVICSNHNPKWWNGCGSWFRNGPQNFSQTLLYRKFYLPLCVVSFPPNFFHVAKVSCCSLPFSWCRMMLKLYNDLKKEGFPFRDGVTPAVSGWVCCWSITLYTGILWLAFAATWTELVKNEVRKTLWLNLCYLRKGP